MHTVTAAVGYLAASPHQTYLGSLIFESLLTRRLVLSVPPAGVAVAQCHLRAAAPLFSRDPDGRESLVRLGATGDRPRTDLVGTRRHRDLRSDL